MNIIERKKEVFNPKKKIRVRRGEICTYRNRIVESGFWREKAKAAAVAFSQKSKP